jgi:hypothetical protein
VTALPPSIADAIAALAPSAVAVSVTPYPYASTQELDAVDVTFADATMLPLLVKHLGADRVLPESRAARSAVEHDPAREPLVYAHLLDGWIGAPRVIAVSESALVLPRLDGARLSEIPDVTAWCATAGLLAALHARGATAARQRPEWTNRLAPTCDLGALVDVGGGDLAAARLAELALTVIHGDCYPENVIVDERRRPLAPTIVDWGRARFGPGLLDLAALTSGDWDLRDRQAVAGAYRAAAFELGAAPSWWAEPTEFARDVAASRVLVAAEQLVWNDPTRDWRADAVAAAEELMTCCS